MKKFIVFELRKINKKFIARQWEHQNCNKTSISVIEATATKRGLKETEETEA